MSRVVEILTEMAGLSDTYREQEDLLALIYSHKKPEYQLTEENPCAEIPLKQETQTMLQRSDKKTGPVCYIRGYEQTSLAEDLPFTYAVLKEVSYELAELVKLPGQDLLYIAKQREVLENDMKKLSILLN